MSRGPRYFLKVTIYHPTVLPLGDIALGAGIAGVDAAIWDLPEAKQIVGAQGELITVHAKGFVPKSTDIRLRDRVTVTDGRHYDVVQRILGVSDRDQVSHITVGLRSVDL